MNAKPRQPRARIAVVTMGVKLGDEKRGYTRFRFLSELLVREGFEVDLITSSFQHWEKAQRDCSKECYRNLPYRVVFVDEPGYTKNLDLARIRSHRVAARNLRAHFERMRGSYDLIYAEIPPNDVARACAECAREANIPFVADINDLWPEAMRMVVDVPVLSDIAFYPFARDARIVYRLLSGAVGTSDEYAARPAADRDEPYPRETVYVGNDLAAFDKGAQERAGEVEKPDGEVWAAYAGTLGASYDLATLVEAAALLEEDRLAREARRAAEDHTYGPAQNRPCPPVRVKVLGDGPDREKLEALAAKLGAPVDFLGYQDYASMAAHLCASDIVVNSLVKTAAQSIVTKIGDYLASGNPVVNTGSSPEFRAKVAADGFGLNVEAENAPALARALQELARNASLRKIMGARGRAVAEREFDQARSYQAIVNLIRSLL
ncbi:glycosyltransferase family 4 protein [Rubneribacter sp.]